MSLARRSQDWHAPWNDVTNSSTISRTTLELDRLDDGWQEDGLREVGMEEVEY
jgi:hypothetical protein